MKFNFGVKPFWFWNGDMKDDEIIRQIKEMHNKGIGGFMIHPRQGMNIPYLSEEWFKKVGVALEGAKKYNLEMWLYDEFPYPSGISGGEVISGHPEFEAKVLEVKKVECSFGEKLDIELTWGEVLLAAAYPVENGKVAWNKALDISSNAGIVHKEKIFQFSGLTSYNSKRFFTGDMARKLTFEAPEGNWVIYIFNQIPFKNFKYFETFMDPLNFGAVRRFIETTHEQYKKHFSSEFGKTIKGIFTDETAPVGTDLPWSPILPDLFFTRNGYSLVEKLPALIDYMGEETNKIRYDYWNTVVDTFIHSYDIQIHEWCNQNNLMYIGEKPILRSSQLREMDIPGVDCGHQKVGDEAAIVSGKYRANAKTASSAAHLYKKDGALCEAFHSIGWSTTQQDLKWIYDWLAVQGINVFVPHAFYFTTDSLAKHDAPPSIFYQMPYWKHADELSEYLKGVLETVSKGKRKVEVLLLDPVTSTWTAMGEKSKLKSKVLKDFEEVQRVLVENHMDYYLIDPQLLGDSQIDNGSININDEKYKVLILSPNMNLEKKALRAVERLMEQGGTVIYTGCLPVENIEGEDAAKVFDRYLKLDSRAVYDDYINDRSQDTSAEIENIHYVSDASKLPQILRKTIRNIEIASHEGETRKVAAAQYSNSEREIYFIVNTSGKAIDTTVTLYNIDKSSAIKKVQMGKKVSETVLSSTVKGDSIEVGLSLVPYEACLVVADKTEAQAEEKNEREYLLNLDGQWNVALKGMNALRMDDWRLEVKNTEEWGFEYSATAKEPVHARPVIDQIAESHIPLPVSIIENFGCPKEMKFPSLNLRYEAEFISETDTEMWLVQEPGSIEGSWHIELNGNIIKPSDFINKEIYLPSNLAVNITSFVNKGLNNVSVFVEATHKDDGLLNPLYIFGAFGTFRSKGNLDVWALTAVPEQSGLFNKDENGLGFYAGDIEFGRIVELPETAENEELAIVIKDLSMQSTAEMYVNGKPLGVKAWSPYKWAVNSSVVKKGGNDIRLVISTDLLGLFEGQKIDPLKRTLSDI